MQIKKIFCLILCFILFLSSCAKKAESESQATTSVSTTAEETTVIFPSKLSHENTTIGNSETIAVINSENYKIFIDYEWNISKEFLKCYYNPENKEGYNIENRYGIADKNGNIIIEPQFGYICPVAKDRFLVANGTKNEVEELVSSEYAVINSKGEIIIPFVPYIESMTDYYDGLESNYFCIRTENQNYYLADNNGNMVYDMYFTDFRVANPTYYTNQTHCGIYDDKAYYFDQDLNIVKIIDDKPVVSEKLYTGTNMKYSKTVCFKDGNYYYGVINETTGKEIVPCKYDEITRFANDRILASSDNEEPVTKADGRKHYGNTIAIYDFYGNVLCHEGTYHSIVLGEAKFNSNDEDKTYKIFEAVGVASAYNPNGNGIYGTNYEWVIDKNGTKISDKYYSVYYNTYGEMAGTYTADRGDRVFYLDKYGKVISTIGQ